MIRANGSARHNMTVTWIICAFSCPNAILFMSNRLCWKGRTTIQAKQLASKKSGPTFWLFFPFFNRGVFNRLYFFPCFSVNKRLMGVFVPYPFAFICFSSLILLGITENGGRKTEKNRGQGSWKEQISGERSRKKRAKAGWRGPGICAQNNTFLFIMKKKASAFQHGSVRGIPPFDLSP